MHFSQDLKWFSQYLLNSMGLSHKLGSNGLQIKLYGCMGCTDNTPQCTVWEENNVSSIDIYFYHIILIFYFSVWS